MWRFVPILPITQAGTNVRFLPDALLARVVNEDLPRIEALFTSDAMNSMGKREQRRRRTTWPHEVC